ncbi:MAG TPA: succinate dehydrogenase, hydrophobic membrane anchor protein [Spongiibacteraceae bacterium]|nr:succinate dehydrogenase, hydrophobic membrane anchor protein [Spongiibacteraceae bacterium]
MVTAVTSFGRSGLSDWLVQRVTAVILLAYVLFIGGFIFFCPELNYTTWKALFACTSMRIFSLAAVLSIAAHAWIGLWSVSTDYLTERLMGSKGTVLRLVFQAVVAIVLFSYVIWGIQILWGNHG